MFHGLTLSAAARARVCVCVCVHVIIRSLARYTRITSAHLVDDIYSYSTLQPCSPPPWATPPARCGDNGPSCQSVFVFVFTCGVGERATCLCVCVCVCVWGGEGGGVDLRIEWHPTYPVHATVQAMDWAARARMAVDAAFAPVPPRCDLNAVVNLLAELPILSLSS